MFLEFLESWNSSTSRANCVLGYYILAIYQETLLALEFESEPFPQLKQPTCSQWGTPPLQVGTCYRFIKHLLILVF